MNEHAPSSATPDPSLTDPPAAVAESPLAFPDRDSRVYPDSWVAGSAVSAVSALSAVRPTTAASAPLPASGIDLTVPHGVAAAERGTLMETMRMEVLERSHGRVVVRMPVDGALLVAGILHGGATAALIETAASVAAREAAPAGAVPVGTELAVSHLRSVRGGRVTAVATPLHEGRRTAVYEVRVSDDDGHLVAFGTLRSLFG